MVLFRDVQWILEYLAPRGEGIYIRSPINKHPNEKGFTVDRRLSSIPLGKWSPNSQTIFAAYFLLLTLSIYLAF